MTFQNILRNNGVNAHVRKIARQGHRRRLRAVKTEAGGGGGGSIQCIARHTVTGTKNWAAIAQSISVASIW